MISNGNLFQSTRYRWHLAIFAAILYNGCGLERQQVQVAQYSNFAFRSRGATFNQISAEGIDTWNASSETKGRLYVRFPDGHVKHVATIVPSDIETFYEDQGAGTNEDTRLGDSNGENMFVFSQGKLKYFYTSSRQLAFGPSDTGPFVTLPVNRTTLTDTFGSPTWRVEHVQAP